MSWRSYQAQRLARALTEDAEADVQLVFIGDDHWDVYWSDGPTRPLMKRMVADRLADGKYPAMADRKLTYHRNHTPLAFAAVAVAAAGGGGALAEYTAAALTRRAELGMPEPAGDWTAAEHALIGVVGEFIAADDHPDRPATSGDAPLIETLLIAGNNDEHAMARLLLGGGTVPSLDNLPTDELAARRADRFRP